MSASLSLDGRRFRRLSDGGVLAFREDREGRVTASYEGGGVVRGSLVGARDQAGLTFAYAQLGVDGQTSAGTAVCQVEALPDGRLRVLERWADPSGTGDSVLEEVPGPRFVRARLGRPVTSLETSARFYRELLGLPVEGPHVGTPYDLVFVTLPGGTELELVVGGPAPQPGTEEDLLVLYLASTPDVEALAASLAAAGVVRVPAANPYWKRFGVTVLDPDGYRVVLTSPPGT